MGHSFPALILTLGLQFTQHTYTSQGQLEHHIAF